MATRATIKIDGYKTCKLYKHWDGYPSATLPWLEEFNLNFAKNRGDDPEYKMAQLIRSSAFDSDKFKLDKNRETGWGVVPFKSDCGAEYEYVLYDDGSVTFCEC